MVGVETIPGVSAAGVPAPAAAAFGVRCTGLGIKPDVVDDVDALPVFFAAASLRRS